MFSYREALETILHKATLLPIEEIPLEQGLNRAIARDLVSCEEVPPFTNSAMDGFALRASDSLSASPVTPQALLIVGDLAAGSLAKAPLQPGTALRIMTGAPLPDGADTVVPVEQVQVQDNQLILTQPIQLHADIRFAGEDIQRGQTVVSQGTRLSPGMLGVLASLGCSQIPVHRRVRVAVLTTGNELVDIHERPVPGKIRDSNSYALCAQLQSFGAEPQPLRRVPDTLAAVCAALEAALEAADVILSTGGISVGDYDFVKPALESLGARCHFWKVRQKPGGPLGFYELKGKPCFGIPGNPVAAMVMMEEYIRPMLLTMMGQNKIHRPIRQGILQEGWSKSRPDAKLHFLRVVAKQDESDLQVRLTGPQGSGILSSMMQANALALIPEDCDRLNAGAPIMLHLTDLPEDH